MCDVKSGERLSFLALQSHEPKSDGEYVIDENGT
jgi:hypothetical protein